MVPKLFFMVLQEHSTQVTEALPHALPQMKNLAKFATGSLHPQGIPIHL